MLNGYQWEVGKVNRSPILVPVFVGGSLDHQAEKFEREEDEKPDQERIGRDFFALISKDLFRHVKAQRVFFLPAKI